MLASSTWIPLEYPDFQRIWPAMFWAYVLANPAGVMRVLLPTIILSYYKTWLILAAILWSTAFAILVIIYAYVLISPRIDGRAG
jgi:uncharacterized protein involved in response to NO